MIKTVSNEVFKNTKGVSYSRLSNLVDGPKAYQAGLVDDPESSAISIGSAIDIMLTEPDNFKEKVYVMSASKPSAPMMLKFTEALATTGDQKQAHTASGFKIGVDAVMKKFKTEGQEYFNALIKGKDKKILDIDDMFIVNNIVDTLKSNPFTKKYFIPEDGVELIFQANIIWDLMYHSLLDGKSTTVTAKSGLDIIRIDHRAKTIEAVDLKTGAESFMKSYWKWKRYLQGSMYQDAVVKSVWSNPDYKEDYTFENFKFIFADTNLWYPPVIYCMTDNDMRIGTHGLNHTSISFEKMDRLNTWKIKGYAQLAAELEWHQKNNQWDYSYDVYQRNGEVNIDAFTFKF